MIVAKFVEEVTSWIRVQIESAGAKGWGCWYKRWIGFGGGFSSS